MLFSIKVLQRIHGLQKHNKHRNLKIQNTFEKSAPTDYRQQVEVIESNSRIVVVVIKNSSNCSNCTQYTGIIVTIVVVATIVEVVVVVVVAVVVDAGIWLVICAAVRYTCIISHNSPWPQLTLWVLIIDSQVPVMTPGSRS